MSAYMISVDHACALVTAYLELRSGGRGSSFSDHLAAEATAMVRDLLTECERSVRHRYPTAGDDLPGPIGAPPISETTFAAVPWSTPYATHRNRTLARVINAARCYSYQACEHPEWIGSRGHQIITDLIEMASAALARQIDSTWTVTGRDHFTAAPEVA